MDDDGDGKVIEMKHSAISDILAEDNDPVTDLMPPELREWAAKAAAEPKRYEADQQRRQGHGLARPPAPGNKPAEDDAAAVAPEKLAPLPSPGSPYEEPHSRLANRPLTIIFFLPEEQLPRGFSYSGMEQVWMAEPARPGESPDLMLRFNGSVITEVRIEGRNLLRLCDTIGRHLVHWVRQHPSGKDDGRAAVFIRRITITVIER
jgi:hypothetical protein